MEDRYILKDVPVEEAVEQLFALSGGDGRSKELSAFSKSFLLYPRESRGKVVVLFSPARLSSTAAKVDKDSIAARACFLCPENLLPGQQGVLFKDRYLLLVNPFPIFHKHLTIPDIAHTRQQISDRLKDMLELAQALSEYVVCYNGPKCGASAPDHMHFQAGNKGFLPIEKEWESSCKTALLTHGEAVLWELKDDLRPAFIIESGSMDDAEHLFRLTHNAMEVKEGDYEPMMNLLAWYEENKWVTCLFPREKHRPSCYTAEGEENRLISPGAADMGGVFVTPLEKDFQQVTPQDIGRILDEVCISADKMEKLKQTIRENYERA